MKISLSTLKQFIDLPLTNFIDIANLFEDLGLEIKNKEQVEQDWWLTLELLANRGDHHCYEGIARELNGRLASGVKNISYKDIDFIIPVNFEILAQRETLSFSLVEFCKSNPSTLDEKLVKMLSVSNINSINVPIDITNIINLEIGQPMHVYDADKVCGKIQVRLSKKGEQADLLFYNQKVVLPEGTLVIADEEKILSIAGVIGCKGASVDDNTNRFYLETALFDPVAVRKTSKKIGIQTLSSMRFERGGDLGCVKKGVKRACYFYEQYGWNIASSCEIYQKLVELPVIDLNINELNVALDTELSITMVHDFLKRLDFNSIIEGKKLLVRVPSHRIWDVKLKEDLIEEIAKIIGYNQLPNIIPPVLLGADKSIFEKLVSEVNQFLILNGFSEVITDALYSGQYLNQIETCQADSLKAHIEILNSCDKGYSLLKNNTILQAVNLVSQNHRMHNNRVKAFEWSKIFLPVNDGNSFCKEEERLWGIAVGSIFPMHFQTNQLRIDLLYFKGLLSNLACHIGAKWSFTVPAQVPDLLHPQKTLAIKQNNEVIGYCGEIAPKLLLLNDLTNVSPVYFELRTDKLKLVEICRSVKDRNLTERDICITLDLNVSAGEVINKIMGLNVYPIFRVFLKDIFVKDSKRNITYTIIYQITNFTSVEEINRWTAEIKKQVEDSC